MWILSQPQSKSILTDLQKKQLTILFNAIQPGSKEDGVPNAEQAGAIDFIDFLLSLDAAVFEDIPGWKKKYPEILEELNKQSTEKFKKALDLLSPEESVALLTLFEKEKATDFDLLRKHCIQGCFCDPRWKGNKDKLMWKWFGYQEETKTYKP